MSRLLKLFQEKLRDSNNRIVEVFGDSIKDCLNAAGEYLSLEVEDLDYEVLSKGKNFFLYKTPYHIRAFPIVQFNGNSHMSHELSENSGSSFVFNENIVSEDTDGQFFVKWNANGVFVKVSPKIGSGKEVALEDIEEFFNHRGIEKYSKQLLKDIIEKKQNKLINLSTTLPSKDFAKYKLEVKNHDLQGFVTLYQPNYKERDLTDRDIERAIRDMRIISSIDKKAIRHHINNCIFATPFVAVEGKEPTYGRDAYINYHVNINNNNFLLEDEAGKVDYKESSLIENVSKDQLLAEKVNKTIGVDGVDLFGVNIPSGEGKDINFYHIKGKGTYLNKEETKLYSLEDGQVLYVEGQLKVDPVFETSEDVGPKTGNIRFNGSIIINGNVLDGYTVESEKDIEIKGTLQKGKLKAKNNILIRGGCSGGGEVVSTEGSIYSKFVQNSELESASDIIVSEGIVHSNISAGSKIICSGKKASIIGGNIRVKELIIASNIGSAAAPKTKIEMGYDPNLIKEKHNMDENIKSLVEQMKTIKLNIKSMESRKEADSLSFDQEAQEELKKLQEEDNKIQEVIAAERMKLEEFSQDMIRNGFNALLYIRERLFSNVFLTIKNAYFNSKGLNKQSGCYFEELGKVNFNPLEGVSLQKELNKFSKKNK